MRKTKEILDKIIQELYEISQEIKQEQLDELQDKIRKAGKIFVAGAGRSLLMIRGLAMRLMHIGYESYVVGETVTPAIEEGDLLIIASGSGSTATLEIIAGKCKSMGAGLALITTAPESPIGEMADCIVEIPAATTKVPGNRRLTIQPGANTFEQSVLLVGDAVIISLMEGKSLEDNNESLMKHHANLE